MVDIVTVLNSVVLPAVEAVFREGEETALDFDSAAGSAQVILTAGGETFSDEVVQAGVPGGDLGDWRERLRSNLVDFVAETRFGWGQNRDKGPIEFRS